MFCAIINTPHLCLETIYSNERALLGSGGALIREGALIKKFSKGGAHSNKYGIIFILKILCIIILHVRRIKVLKLHSWHYLSYNGHLYL